MWDVMRPKILETMEDLKQALDHFVKELKDGDMNAFQVKLLAT